MRKLSYFLLLLGSYVFLSCSDDKQFSEIGETTISKLNNTEELNLPFEDEAVLKSFSEDSKILEYNKARKLTLIEMIGTGFDKEMGWEGYRLSQIPVVLYGFDNKPKFYDFIVLNAESKPVGTITAYARKAASTIIKEVSPNIKDYGLLLSKASLGGNKASLFVDWTGNSYVGLLGKSDETPTSVVNVETGNVAEEIKELEGAEIIQELQKDMLPALLPQDFSIYDNLTSEGNQELQEEIEASKTLTLNVLVDSMKTTCQQDVENTKAFWTELETEVPNITEMNDDEILDANGKSWFSRLVRRVFSGVDRKVTYLNRYVNSGTYYGTTTEAPWCGPWACGYILYVKTKENKYEYFTNCASSFGEFGFLNVALRIFGKPMTPAEMAWSMPIASKGKIKISPFPWFTDFAAYDQIHHYGKPALRLCSKSGELHWTVAYGTYQSGNYFWRNYYFLQQDNSWTNRGASKSPTAKSNYLRADWWNPWFMVWD